MSENKPVKQSLKNRFMKHLPILGIGMLALCAVLNPAAASEYVFNGTIGDLGQVIDDFLTLDTSLIKLVIFGIVITCCGAVGAFITGFFAMILSNMRLRV